MTAGVTLVVAIIVAALAISNGIPSWAVPFLIMGTAVPVLGGMLWLATRDLPRVHEVVLAGAERDLAALVRDLLPALEDNPRKHARELVQTLVSVGRCSQTVRLTPAAMADSIDPVRVPFEPQALEQVRLDSETGTPTGESASRASGYVRRNYSLKGNPALLVVFGVVTTVWIWLAIDSRSVPPPFLAWLATMALMLLAPIRSARGGQWLLVPGGLALRRFRRGGRSSVHVFARTASALCLYRSSSRGWEFVVADDVACERGIATRDEVQAVLRAWLSPLPPPTAEQMSDWA